MAYLELAPAITALRSRPEEFEFSNDTLHHVRSRHRFHFVSDDHVQIHADCACSILRPSREQTKVFHTAYREWYASYWRPLEINREFASHFAPPSMWRRLAIWLLRRLLSWPQPASSPSLKTALSRSRSADGALGAGPARRPVNLPDAAAFSLSGWFGAVGRANLPRDIANAWPGFRIFSARFVRTEN